MLPLAETICQTTQTFAGRISLFRSNWKALTQEPWLIQTVLEGYHIPLLSAPLQQSPPCNPHMSAEDAAMLEEEIQSLLQKQAICQISVPTEEFYSNMFIVPKKDGDQRPVINLKHLNKFVKSEHFKMEGLHTVKALLRIEKRLDGQSGPEGCLLYGPNSPSISSSPTLQVGGEDIPVQMPPLWSMHSPKGLYKDSQAISGDAQISGYLTSNLLGRYAIDGKLQAEAIGSHPDVIVSPREPGVHHQQQKIYRVPSPRNRISGNDGKLSNYGPEITKGEDQKNQAGSSPPAILGTTISSITLPAFREAKCNHSSSANGTIILPLTTNLPEASPISQPAELPGSGPIIPSSAGRSSVVGTPPQLLEWTKPNYLGIIHDNNIRCFPTKLGSNFQWNSDQRSLVSIRKISSHQLPRAASCYISSSNICQGEVRNLNSPTTGQLYSSCLYQQKGGGGGGGGQHHQNCLS